MRRVTICILTFHDEKGGRGGGSREKREDVECTRTNFTSDTEAYLDATHFSEHEGYFYILVQVQCGG